MNSIFGEPIVRVGLSEGSGFGLTPHGHFNINASEDLITYQPLDPDAYMQISGIEIGRSFHWQSTHTFHYNGIIQVMRKDNATLLINILKAEQYLKSVVGSEMNPLAPSEFIKAHAIIARSWLMRTLQHKRAEDHSSASEVHKHIVWTDNKAHSFFDVCCDDHCQRYQGIDTVTPISRAAVEETRGLVLVDKTGEIADTRYSKCCGGKTELFSSCWQDEDYDYLTSKEDPYCHPERLKKALNHNPNLLKDYDALTSNYYEWEEEVSLELISKNLNNLLHINIGEIVDLIPEKIGPSNRIIELLIKGSKGNIIVGKELEIRRLLSKTHLLSSAFTIEKRPDAFILKAKGWGHGVGLCQIGAAVMAVEGYSYKEILDFYFPNTQISKYYD